MEMQKFNLYVNVKETKVVQKVMLVAERAGSDVNGNPVHLIKVFMYNEEQGYGHEWNPPLAGRRTRKDGKYRIVGAQRSMLHMMEDFRNELQEYLEKEYV